MLRLGGLLLGELRGRLEVPDGVVALLLSLNLLESKEVLAIRFVESEGAKDSRSEGYFLGSRSE